MGELELLAALDEIRERARLAQLAIWDGRAVTGGTALRAIQYAAEDAMRHHHEDRLAGEHRFGNVERLDDHRGRG